MNADPIPITASGPWFTVRTYEGLRGRKTAAGIVGNGDRLRKTLRIANMGSRLVWNTAIPILLIYALCTDVGQIAR